MKIVWKLDKNKDKVQRMNQMLWKMAENWMKIDLKYEKNCWKTLNIELKSDKNVSKTG